MPNDNNDRSKSQSSQTWLWCIHKNDKRNESPPWNMRNIFARVISRLTPVRSYKLLTEIIFNCNLLLHIVQYQSQLVIFAMVSLSSTIQFGFRPWSRSIEVNNWFVSCLILRHEKRTWRIFSNPGKLESALPKPSKISLSKFFKVFLSKLFVVNSFESLHVSSVKAAFSWRNNFPFSACFFERRFFAYSRRMKLPGLFPRNF